MAKDPGEKRSKIFPGKGEQEPVVEEDKTEKTTAIPPKDEGTVYKAGRKYEGKHKK
jgi:hypothetical protein